MYHTGIKRYDITCLEIASKLTVVQIQSIDPRSKDGFLDSGTFSSDQALQNYFTIPRILHKVNAIEYISTQCPVIIFLIEGSRA